MMPQQKTPDFSIFIRIVHQVVLGYVMLGKVKVNVDLYSALSWTHL